MNQHDIYIVDSSIERKLSRFSQNFQTFPPPHPIFAEGVLSEDRISEGNSVKKHLQDLISISLGPSQWSGLFIFSVERELKRSGAGIKYTLSWRSFPMCMALFRFILVVVVAGIYQGYKDELYDRFGVNLIKDSTLGVTEAILSLTVFSSDFIGSWFLWKERKRTQAYLNRLGETLALFAEEVKEGAWIQEWFGKASTNGRRLVQLIDASTIISIFLMSYQDILELLTALQGKSADGDGLDLSNFMFPIFAVLWFTVVFKRLHFRVLLIANINALQFGFRTIKEHVKAFGIEHEPFVGVDDIQIVKSYNGDGNRKRNIVISALGDTMEDGKTNGDKGQMDIPVTSYLREVKLTQIIEKYRAMEILLDGFNELFAPHLLIGIGSIVIVILMACFHFLADFNKGLNWMSGAFGFEALVYIAVLFSLGTAATEMANEADSCITALRDVPLTGINPALKQKIMLHFQHAMAVPLVISPGSFFSLNRKMLTSVAGTLTTYLIVLIQFQTSEKPHHDKMDNSTMTELPIGQ